MESQAVRHANLLAACEYLLSSITKASSKIGEFVLSCRTARTNLEGVSRELSPLQTVVQLISNDAARLPVPETLALQAQGIIDGCGRQIATFTCLLDEQKRENAEKWGLVGKEGADNARCKLEFYKSVLEIVLDTIDLQVVHGTLEIVELTGSRSTRQDQQEAEQILSRIEELRKSHPQSAEMSHLESLRANVVSRLTGIETATSEPTGISTRRLGSVPNESKPNGSQEEPIPDPESPLEDLDKVLGDLPGTIPYFPPSLSSSIPTTGAQNQDRSLAYPPGIQRPLHRRSQSSKSSSSSTVVASELLLDKISSPLTGGSHGSRSTPLYSTVKQPYVSRTKSIVSDLEVARPSANRSRSSDLETVLAESPGLELVARSGSGRGIPHKESYSGLQAVPQHTTGLEIAPSQNDASKSNAKSNSNTRNSRISSIKVVEGDLTFDYRIPSSLYAHLADAPEKESLYSTYTAITCLPSEFNKARTLPSARWHYLRRHQTELVIALCPRSDRDMAYAFTQIQREASARPLPGKQTNSSWREIVFLVQIERRNLHFFEAVLRAMGLWFDWEPVRPRLDGGTQLQEYDEKDTSKRWVGRCYAHNVLVQHSTLCELAYSKETQRAVVLPSKTAVQVLLAIQEDPNGGSMEPTDFTAWAKAIADSFKARLLVYLEMGDGTAISEGAFHELWQKHAQDWEGYNGVKAVRYSLRKALGISSSWTSKLN